MEEKELINLLENLIGLLEVEKTALIEDDGDKLMEIVKEKEKIVKLLENADEINVDFEKIDSLMGTINELQETNLLLTKQAMSYQNSFIEAIAKSNNTLDSTYSADGKRSKQSINLVDQSW